MTVNLLIAYAHRDVLLMHEILRHLKPLQQQGVLGKILKDEVSSEEDVPDEDALQDAHVILLLVSPDFLNSNYCYSPVMRKVIDQHEQRGNVRVIPVLLRPVYWQATPFSQLSVIPHNVKPIALWQNQDEALFECIGFIRGTVAIIDKQASQGASFLIIDNDSKFVETLLSTLKNNGYSVLNTTNAAQALTFWREQEPDVALLSTSLYGEDSLALLQAMRRRGKGGICVISSVGTLEDKIRWFAAGVDDYVTRPVDHHHLFARMRLLQRMLRRDKEFKGIKLLNLAHT